jgi:threonine aldolase
MPPASPAQPAPALPAGADTSSDGEVASDAQVAELREQCTRFLHGHGPVRAADLLATIPADTAVDRYGDGGAVAALERQIAELLGKPSAVFLPSGTMAQQAALRVHADRRGRRAVVFHPMCHLERHEGQAYRRLQMLTGRAAGDPNRLITMADLASIAEPVAALLLELPQRDIGGQQPPWDELIRQCDWARAGGAAVHLDGARLWESAAGYGRAPGDVAGLFDTVYVSFYKGVGALPGCCVAGTEEIVAEVREWRQRLGGTLAGLWPNAASALHCLAVRLPRMAAYLEHARAIAAALTEIPGVRVVPDPPHTSMMHLLLATTADRFAAAARRLAANDGMWTWPHAAVTADPSVQRVELAVGDATCALSVPEIAGSVAALVSA